MRKIWMFSVGILCMSSSIFSMDHVKQMWFDFRVSCDPDLEKDLYAQTIFEGAVSKRIARRYQFRGSWPLAVGQGSEDWDKKNKVNADLLQRAAEDVTGVAMRCLVESFEKLFTENQTTYEELDSFLSHHNLSHLLEPPVTSSSYPTFLSVSVQDGRKRPHNLVQHSLLAYLVSTERKEALSYALEQGADVNEPSVAGTTPFVTSLNKLRKRPDIVRLLLKYKPDVNVRSCSGRTALIDAAMQSDHESQWIIDELIDRGADVMAETMTGQTALHGLAHHGSVQSLYLISALGAKYTYDTMYKRTPLWRAAAAGNAEAVEFFCRQGALDEPDDFGETPSHAAMRFGHNDCAWIIQQAGKQGIEAAKDD